MEGFQEDYKSAKSQVDERQKQFDADRRAILRSYLAVDVDRLETIRSVVDSQPARLVDPDDAPPENNDESSKKTTARGGSRARAVRHMELDHRAYLAINIEAARRAVALRGVSDKKRRAAEKQFRKELIDVALECVPPASTEEPKESLEVQLMAVPSGIDISDLPDDDDW